MIPRSTQLLADTAARIAAQGARRYLDQHHLTAESDALDACLRAWVKLKLPEALHDAGEAIACNMGQAAEATFTATMVQAGIEAAKEAGFPVRQQDRVINTVHLIN